MGQTFAAKLAAEGLTLKDFIRREQNYMGMVQLPSFLPKAIMRRTKMYPSREIKSRLVKFREAFNSHKSDKIFQVQYGLVESAAFLAYVPLFYAPVANIFNQLTKINDFSPKTMLDYGCGPGTAVIAANQYFPSIDRAVAIDASQNMLDHCVEIFKDDNLKNISLETKLQNRPMSNERFDLVIASFLLSDLPNDNERNIIIAGLWKQTGDILVLVDRGAPFSSELIKNARELVLQLSKKEETEVHIVAPVLSCLTIKCPHEKACPMDIVKTNWCHFSQRVSQDTEIVI